MRLLRHLLLKASTKASTKAFTEASFEQFCCNLSRRKTISSSFTGGERLYGFSNVKGPEAFTQFKVMSTENDKRWCCLLLKVLKEENVRSALADLLQKQRSSTEEKKTKER